MIRRSHGVLLLLVSLGVTLAALGALGGEPDVPTTETARDSTPVDIEVPSRALVAPSESHTGGLTVEELEAASTRSEVPAGRTVSILVFKEPEDLVADAEVTLSSSHGATVLRATTGPDGTVEFRAVPPGPYRVLVDVEHLGLLAPLKQDTRAPWASSGYYATDLDVQEGDAYARIRVFEPATMSGLVIGPEGPIENAGVTIADSAPGLEGMSCIVRASEDGRFAAAGLYPGRKTVRVELDGHAPKTVPLPIFVPVPEGGHVDGVQLVCGRGTGSVSGRIVDQEGRPVERIDVKIYWDRNQDDPTQRTTYADTVANIDTDEDGVFRVTGLDAGPYSIAAGTASTFDHTSRLARWMDPIRLRLSSDAVDLGDVAVVLNDPCHLEVELVGASRDASQYRILFADPRQIDRSQLDERGFPTMTGVRPFEFAPDADGRFRLRLKAPADDVILYVQMDYETAPSDPWRGRAARARASASTLRIDVMEKRAGRPRPRGRGRRRQDLRDLPPFA